MTTSPEALSKLADELEHAFHKCWTANVDGYNKQAFIALEQHVAALRRPEQSVLGGALPAIDDMRGAVYNKPIKQSEERRTERRTNSGDRRQKQVICEHYCRTWERRQRLK